MGDGATTRRSALRAAGILFLAAILAYGTGSALVESLTGAPDVLATVSAHPERLETGALLMLLNSVCVATIGVLFFPILARRTCAVAAAYLATRIVEGALLAIGVIFLYLLVPAGREGDATLATLAVEGNGYAYQVAMLALGLGSLPFCALLYRSRLAPPWLAGWGLAGYAVFAAGAVMELFGVGVGLALSIPGGLFEVAFGLWLIARGFRAAPDGSARSLAPAPTPAD